jgi:hypothetical protein
MKLATRIFVRLFSGLTPALLLAPALSLAAVPSDLRLNHIQIKGTHNSYHQQSLIAFHKSHKYTHLPLTEQLEKRGIRAFELDVHRPTSGSDLQVYHIAVVDSKTTCSRFKDCLTELKNWSDRNPQHVTIFVWIEVKDSTGGPKFVDFNRVDEEIREVLGDRLITPDDLQGSHETLQAAIQKDGWPTVEAGRGRFIFMLDSDDRTPTVYLNNDSLRGRVMLPRANEATLEKPWAVVTKTDPGSFHDAALAKNFMISVNVCSPESNAADCQSRLQRSLDAGTNILMDDFEGDAPKQSLNGYYLQLRDQLTVNCNPVTSVGFCAAETIDQVGG